MAFDLTALSAYIEDQDFPLIAQMQATGGLAEVADIQTGIKGSSNLQFLSTDVEFQADSCTRTGSGETAFTQRTITVGAITVAEDLCIKDLNGYWAQTLVKQGAAGEEEMPAAIEAVYMEKKMNALANALIAFSSSCKPLIKVTPLPLRPLVSRCKRITPSLSGAFCFCFVFSTFPPSVE